MLAAGNSNARPGLAFKNFAAHAQHTAMPMIGFLNGGSSWEYAQMAATFRKGLGETGLLIVVLALVKPLSPPGDLSGQLICGPIEA